jgi:hypothetical protein
VAAGIDISTRSPKKKVCAQESKTSTRQQTMGSLTGDNGLSLHTNEDEDDGDGSGLFVWDMKQMLVTVMT